MPFVQAKRVAFKLVPVFLRARTYCRAMTLTVAIAAALIALWGFAPRPRRASRGQRP